MIVINELFQLKTGMFPSQSIAGKLFLLIKNSFMSERKLFYHTDYTL